MERVKDAGKARSIVVSNFLQSHLDTVSKSARIPPSTNQIEYHPYLQHGNLVPFQKDKGIQTASYAPLTPATWRKVGLWMNCYPDWQPSMQSTKERSCFDGP
ncbi:hypothetical protein AWENTII_011213 [Aspergillus wentii]